MSEFRTSVTVISSEAPVVTPVADLRIGDIAVAFYGESSASIYLTAEAARKTAERILTTLAVREAEAQAVSR